MCKIEYTHGQCDRYKVKYYYDGTPGNVFLDLLILILKQIKFLLNKQNKR